MKDKIFIFITVVLIILFAVTIAENFFLSHIPSIPSGFPTIVIPAKAGIHKPVDSRFRGNDNEVRLEPQEAKYYKVINE